MAPTGKENNVLVESPSASATSGSTSFRPDETASRPQPVALELPITVNGARTVEGSDKREPFSETTKTVLVFGNGAVIRLSSPVAPGQLLFLTNEKTKKEVVCQVVKSKNYKSMSGYVELEFTESVVGFWGMRFPSDRPAGQAAPTTATTSAAKPSPLPPPPISAAPEKLPAAPVSPSQVAVPPASAATPTPLESRPSPVQPQPKGAPSVPVAEIKPPLPPPKDATVSAPRVETRNEAPIVPASAATSLASSFLSLISSPELPSAVPPRRSLPEPAASATIPPAPQEAPGTSPEELKSQTARLQEQLSALAFADEPNAKRSNSAGQSKPADSALASKIFELEKTATQSEASLPPAKAIPPVVKSALDDEQLQIPSWLEPLARNAAAPATTQELIEREKAKHAAELAARATPPPEPLPVTAPEVTPEPEPVGIGNLLPLDEDPLPLTEPSQGSKKGVWLAAAAVIVALASVGGWYYFQNLQPPQTSVAPVTRNVSPQKDSVTPPSVPAQTTAPAPSQAAPVEPEPLSQPSQPDAIPATPSVKPAEGPKPLPAVRDKTRDGATTIPAASTERIPKSTAAAASPAPAPAEPEPKKPSIGEVHLASPMVNRPAKNDEGIAAPTISEGDPATNLGAGLSEPASGQPAPPETPLPVGGDVHPAKLISSVSPVYPAMAKQQNVYGDVQIDALIDATGKVTTMKVVSGPALLQRPAMDALHQWKYQPATLDGKPVPMHVTVTLRFRMP